MGGLELAAFFSSVSFAIVATERPVARLLAALASACVLAMVLIWAVWIYPINKAVNSWTFESLPSNWADFRDRWHSFHTVRFVLSVVGFVAVIAASFI
jgi:hypothetical protein